MLRNNNQRLLQNLFLALIDVAVLFIVAFRQLWRPLLVVATLLVAIGWTMGLTTLTVGHLNILSVSFMPILIGLGVIAVLAVGCALIATRVILPLILYLLPTDLLLPPPQPASTAAVPDVSLPA